MRPTGSVSLSTDSSGTFRNQQGTVSSSCTLTAVPGGPAECHSISYTPTALGSGTHMLTASYNGDGKHLTSTGRQSLRLLHPTRNEILCFSPSSHAGTITCEDLITDAAPPGSAQTPTGVVQLSGVNATVEPRTCTLTQFVSEIGPIPGEAICVYSVIPHPTGEGKTAVSLGSSFTSNAVHEGSGTSTTVTFPAVSHTSVTCAPAQLGLGRTTTCTITAETAPGEVLGATSAELRSSQPATFPGSGICQIRGGARTGSCTAEVKPSVAGHPILTARYLGGQGVEESQGNTTVEVIRESRTAVECTPPDLGPGGPSACTVTVEDPLGGPASEARPTGSVTLSSNGEGAFSPAASCTLEAVDDSEAEGRCQLTYTPAKTGAHVVTASYGGDPQHLTSQGAAGLTVHRETATQISCAPPSAPVGAALSCTATVTDSSQSPAQPTGRVDFFNEGPGGFEGDSFCPLSAAEAPDASACSVTYKPTAVGSGSHKITAFYNGTAGIDASQGNTSVTVSADTTSTTVRCQPASVQTGDAAHCTAEVEDTEAAPSSPPSGQVLFFTDAPGAFSGLGCNLAQDGQGHFTCALDYTPAAGSAGSHHLGAEYQGDPQHESSTATPFALKVRLPGEDETEVTLGCPAAVSVLHAASCEVVATDLTEPATELAGEEVSFASDNSSFFVPRGCTLEAGGTCTVRYLPIKAGDTPRTDHLTVSYAGREGAFTAAVDTVPIDVNPAPADEEETETTLRCDASVIVLHTASCEAAVIDESTPATTLVGEEVSFLTDNGPSSFTAPSCVLDADATCTVLYRPAKAEDTPRTDQLTAVYLGKPGSFLASASAASIDVDPLPLEHPTATAISCQPAPLALGSGASSCTISVEDTEQFGAPSHPGGEVKIERLSGAGQLSAASCDLPKSAQTKVSCEVVAYTPAKAGEHQLKASYEGDETHVKSSATTTIAVGAAQTKTTLACAPGKVLVGAPATCTVAVAAAEGAAAPSGTVKFASDSRGSFGAGGACTLTGAGGGKASCQLTYTPGAPGSGTHRLTAAYQGDADHAASQEAARLQVGTAPDTKIAKRPRRKTGVRSARFTFTSTQAGSSFRCKLDRRRLRSCRSPFKVRRLRRGRHVFSVQAVNADGVADPTPARYRWKVLGHGRKGRRGKKH